MFIYKINYVCHVLISKDLHFYSTKIMYDNNSYYFYTFTDVNHITIIPSVMLIILLAGLGRSPPNATTNTE